VVFIEGIRNYVIVHIVSVGHILSLLYLISCLVYFLYIYLNLKI
jgi:hypothetical protein